MINSKQGAAMMILSAMSLGGVVACRPAESGTGYRGRVMETPVPKPDFTFTATDGQPFAFRQKTEGFVTLLFFGFTTCPDICPVHMANLAQVLRTLPLEVTGSIKVVFVTTDPERDSLPVIRRWLDAFDPSFVGLRGPLDEINRVLASLSLPEAVTVPLPEGGYGVAHPAAVIAFTQDNLARVHYPFGIRQQDWAHDLPLLVRDEGMRP